MSTSRSTIVCKETLFGRYLGRTQKPSQNVLRFQIGIEERSDAKSVVLGEKA